MAQQYVNDDGVVLTVPGTTVTIKVANNPAGIASAGVVTIIGEANEGPHWSEEAKLEENVYSPDEFDRIVTKYGSGRIVDAFNALSAPSSDAAVTGSVTAVRIIKTNASQKASAALDSFANVKAKRAGTPGNLIKFFSANAQLESAPSTGSFTFIPEGSASSFEMQINGAAASLVSISSRMSPDALAAAISNIAGAVAQGGVSRGSLSGKVGLTLTASSPAAGQLQVSLQSGQVFAVAPQVGDTVVIPSSGQYGASSNSVVRGAGGENAGSYRVLSVSNSVSNASILMKREDAYSSLVGASGAIQAQELDLIAFSPISISNYTGTDRNSLVGLSGSVTSVVAGSQITLNMPANFAAQPKAGDYVKLSATFAGVTAGTYIVTSASANSLVAQRVSNGSAGSSSSGSISPSSFSVERPSKDGLGKSMEFKAGSPAPKFLNPSTGASASFMNSLIVSASEQKNSLTISKGAQSDSVTSGGNIIIKVGSSSAGQQMVVSDSDIVIAGNTLPFSQFKTMQDVVDFINSQSGYSAELGSSRFAALAPADLDNGTYDLYSLNSNKPARVKRDAIDWSRANAVSPLASVELLASSGLPEAMSTAKFLAGGTKAGTSSSDFVDAIVACEKLETNFIVPLISQDSSEDILDEETESSSTYTVDAVNAFLKSHVIKMSAEKIAKNRIALVSRVGEYSDVKEAAGSLSNYRVAMCFQHVNALSADGSLKAFQPWMASIVAAGMQAAAGAKGIVKKFANVSGIYKDGGDFDDAVYSDKEDALISGLLFMERVQTGGFRWVSDQMTYSVDSNFVYNSLQAVYIADLMALTIKDRFDKAVVGRSVAEISAIAALGLLEAIMFDFLRLKWIAPSDDAPKGFKNASVKISGGAMPIKVEVKLAGLIYFVPVTMTISQVEQSAGA
jgi:hypothetical protein